MAYWKSKEFQKLRDEWNHKLHESGFVDAEEMVDEEATLKQYASSIKRHIHQPENKGKVDFYNLFCRTINLDPYLRHRDRTILRLYADGVKQKDIIKTLETKGLGCINRITITRVITRFCHKWEIPTRKPRKTR